MVYIEVLTLKQHIIKGFILIEIGEHLTEDSSGRGVCGNVTTS